MSDWMLVATIIIICAYKLIDRWIDTRDTGEEHHSIYSDTERHEREGIRDDSERAIPDIGFRRNK